MTPLPHMGEALSLNARLFPDKPGARDLSRALTFAQNLIVGSKLSEFHTGYRAYSRAALLRIPFLEAMEQMALAGDEPDVIVGSGEVHCGDDRRMRTTTEGWGARHHARHAGRRDGLHDVSRGGVSAQPRAHPAVQPRGQRSRFAYG